MTSETERADKIDRVRAAVAPLLGLVVLSANQWLFFSRDWNDVTPLQLGLWVLMILIVLAIIVTGGTWFASPQVRRLANDEATRASRQAAFKGGFTAAVVMALVVFVVSPFEPLSAQRAAHLIISIALGVALLAFGFAESRNNG